MGAPTAGEVSVLEIDVANHPVAAREVDDAGPRVAVEDEARRHPEHVAIAKRDFDVEELRGALLHDDGDALEPTVGAPHTDAIAVDFAIDDTFAELLEAGDFRMGFEGLFAALLMGFMGSTGVPTPAAGGQEEKEGEKRVGLGSVHPREIPPAYRGDQRYSAFQRPMAHW